MRIAIPILIVLLFIAIAVIAGIVNSRMEKKRSEAMARVASDLKFDFFPTGRVDVLSELSSFHLFSQGHSKAMKNLMIGTAGGLEIGIFDYTYSVGSGKHRQTWNQSVFRARCQGLDLPDFTMRPEGFWHKVGQLFGMHDIDFVDYPKFSKRYLLKGSDEAAIRDLFTTEVLDYFDERSGLNVEGRGDLLVYYRNKKIDPGEIRDFMAEGFEVLKRFQFADAQG